MAGRRLNPDEAALWAKVMASVRPLHRDPAAATPPPSRADLQPSPPPVPAKKRAGRIPPPRPPAKPAPTTRTPPATLDGSWDRKIGRGQIMPDSAIDLHGHSLQSAHALLDEGLARAIARHDRVLLLITGKPPRSEAERPYARGAIRAAVTGWLAASRHADAIAAVRAAHPRHGGNGALYIILRRDRSLRSPIF